MRGRNNGRRALGPMALTSLLVLTTLSLVACNVSAADLVYVITNEEVDVYVQEDGSADIQYEIHITVRPQSSTVNGFKIHLPNWQFEGKDITATMDGDQIVGVRKSRSSETEVEISLNAAEAMQPSTNHIFILVVNVGAMVVKHPSDAGQARVTFRPTWWNPDHVQEIQNLNVHIHLPEDYFDEGSIEHSDGATVNEVSNRLMISWHEENLPPDFKRNYRVDFPASIVDRIYDPFWDLQLHDYEIWLIIILVVVIVVIVVYGVRKAVRRPYVKPYLNFEAWGARKGFGPMDAALVLGLKKERMACMFLMDLVMVGAIEVKDPKTMEVTIENPEYEGRSSQFLSCIRKGHPDPIATSNLIDSIKDEVDAKLEGYDQEATVSHYKAQAPKRWSKFRPSKTLNVDEVLWLMTAEDAKKRFKDKAPKGIPSWTGWKVVV